MKNLLFLYFIIILSTGINAQPFSEAIHSPKLKAYLNSDGPIFYDGYQNGGLSVTEFNNKEVDIKVMFAAGLWIGAKKSDENFTRIARSFYFKEDLLGGPANYSGNINLNRVWIVTREELRDHIQDFEDGIIDENPAIDILQWPGFGNEELGDQFPNREFAPFYDVDNDGIYNAYAGDYPIISEELANVEPYELAYAVFHDDLSSTKPIGVEIHAKMYTLQCEELPLLDRTIFSSHRIVNLSEDYDEFLLGFWYDSDLGCTVDDYVGCSPEHNSFYAYNSDDHDGSVAYGCKSMLEGFGDNPAVQSTRFLNQSLHSFSLIFRDGIGYDIPFPTLTPETDSDIGNRLRGKWLDGSSFTKGGIGYDESSTDFTNFQYSSDPTDTTGWSMLTTEIPLSDRTALSTIEPRPLAKNETIIFDMVQVVTLDENFNHIEKVAISMDETSQIQEAYDNNFEGLCSPITFNKSIEKSEEIKIYPNPVKNDLFVDHNEGIISYHIINVTGTIIQKGEISEEKTPIEINLANGIYWIIFESEESEFRPKKFFVMN